MRVYRGFRGRRQGQGARPSLKRLPLGGYEGWGARALAVATLLMPAVTLQGGLSAQSLCLHSIWVDWLAAAASQLVTSCPLFSQAFWLQAAEDLQPVSKGLHVSIDA